MAPLAQAACPMVEVLLGCPSAPAIAQRAAHEGDDRLLDGCLFEALRFALAGPAGPGGRTEAERGRIERADTLFVSHLHLMSASD